MERPTPATADVSAKSCVAPPLLGTDTPGTSSARSRKFRPFIGSVLISASDTVPAIWLRAASTTGVSSTTVTVSVRLLTARDTGSSNAAPAVSVSLRVASAKPA